MTEREIRDALDRLYEDVETTSDRAVIDLLNQDINEMQYRLYSGEFETSPLEAGK